MFDWNILLFQLGVLLSAITTTAKRDRTRRLFAYHANELGKASYTGAFVAAVLDSVRWESLELLLIGVTWLC